MRLWKLLCILILPLWFVDVTAFLGLSRVLGSLLGEGEQIGIQQIVNNTAQSVNDFISDIGESLKNEATHMLNLFNEPTQMSRKLARCGYLSVMARKEMDSRTSSGLLEDLLTLNFLGNRWLRRYKEECSEAYISVTCNENDKYRSINGSCNNLKNPEWGMSETAQRRFLKPDYDDGVDTPRTKSVTGGALPSARAVSNALHQANGPTSFDPDLTVMHMSFGQFLDHDLIATPIMKGEKNSDIKCCGVKEQQPECIPIDIPTDDPVYSRRCMNLVRSSPAPPPDNIPAAREQLNEVTSYIDASAVYGSSNEIAASLREFTGGRMHMSPFDRLPKGGKSKCLFESDSDFCQKAGDKRVNVVPNLGALHLLFVREHNRIAGRLAAINTHWDDEKLYQETRKIVSALIQHITYSEYLPLILNRQQLESHGISSQPMGFNNVYNTDIDASVRNVFGAAAYRFGHSQVPNHQACFDKFRRPTLVKPIEHTYHRPHMCVMGEGVGADGIMRWLTTAHSTATDRFFENGVRNKLFQDKNKVSLDLPAVNIQRGRDHGIPGYNAWRRWCRLPEVNSFSQLVDHEPGVARILAQLYSHPDDIDLYAGAMSETKDSESLVGPTFACILSQQFQLLKRGDRFWYENEFPRTGFTLAQLNSIKRTTLSKIICNNIHMHEMQINAFKVPSQRNPRKLCSQFPDLEFRFWSE